jgi:hypothetical protein
MSRTYRTGMRLIGAAACASAALSGFASPASASSTVTLVCELRGNQEAPVPVITPARGCGRFIIDRNANTIDFYISFSGLSSPETAAHFHGNAGPGVPAGVKIALPLGNPKVGVVAYAEADEAAILAGLWYVNIHTVNNGGGEIRGQMNHFAALLNAFQEGPAAVASPGQGWGTFRIDTCANRLDYYIVIEPGSLTSAETMAHIHGFSPHTVNSGILHTLPLGSPKVGTWLYNESDEPGILAGLTYVNVHTVNFGGGEIRGQIVNTVVPLDQAQEPACGVMANRHGCMFCSFTLPAGTLGYYEEYAGLTGAESASHFHGFIGTCVNTGVILATAPGAQKKGTWPFGAANLGDVQAGLSYHNVHTPANPGGEIRGQIIVPRGKCLADVDCNGSANIDDLLDVINAWGPCMPNPMPCPSDTDYNGMINIDDLLNVINGWGKCP